MNLRQQLENFLPMCEQEEADRRELLAWLDSGLDVFSRSCRAAHFTASAWVVSLDRKKVLMVYHNLYHSWSWMGGHADGMTDLYAVARKEVREECGLETLKPLCNGIFSLEVLAVDGHEKRGKYVSSHLHLNVTYLFEADPAAPVSIKPDENSGVAWFPAEDVERKVTEPWMQKRVYAKLMERVRTQYPA